MNWSSRSSKTLLLFSAATWIWRQLSKMTALLKWYDLCYIRSQDPPFYLTGLHNKSFIELGSETVVQGCSVTKGVLTKFTGKHLCQSHVLINLQALRLWESGTVAFLWICHDMILFCFPPQVMFRLFLNFLFNITATNQIKKYH